MEHGELRRDKASSWQIEYEQAVGQIVSKEDSTLQDVVDVIWEKGILDRVAPIDEEVKQQRIDGGHETFEGTRNDVELYWRLLASMENMKESINCSVSGGYAAAIISGFSHIYDQKNIDRFFPDDSNRKKGKWQEDLLYYFDCFHEKAKSELEARGEKVPDALPQVGDKGVYHGINVVVKTYAGNGTIYLQGETLNDHRKLFDFSEDYGDGYGGISLKEVCENFHKAGVVDN